MTLVGAGAGPTVRGARPALGVLTLCPHRGCGCTPWLVSSPRAVDGNGWVAAAQILDYLVGDLVP